jgi:GTP-binding protein
MIIHCAAYVKSSISLKQCPAPLKPEFGFIGRSNVGKSSLINMLTGRSKLALTSGTPGKTKTINHFIINDSWYLVDLPGYGYAKVPVKVKNEWLEAVEEYILKRRNLVSLFVLIDSRIKPQESDLSFMEFLGINQVPFARIFTKCDKISRSALEKAIDRYDHEMLKIWELIPVTFITSAVKGTGREYILDYIEESINNFSNSA